MSFLLASDARTFIASYEFAEFELLEFTGGDSVEIEHDGHCGFVAKGKVYFLCDSDLIAFANHLRKV